MAPDQATNQATICFVGDLVGSCGRRTLLALLPSIRERYEPTFLVVNGENVAGGLGITPKIADELFEAGVDVITLGNHSYRRSEILPTSISTSRFCARPTIFARSPATATASSRRKASSSASSIFPAISSSTPPTLLSKPPTAPSKS